MGQADTLTKEYMKDPEVFADAFNYYIYDGEQVIHPEQLNELDTASLAVLFGDSSDNKKNEQIQVYRDILKSVTAMEDGKATYLILGIENQMKINYAMPVRNMLYDALQYYLQVKTIAKINRKSENTLTGDEFLSGITKDDKLLPMITLVVYFGMDPWDGPKSLHEMLMVKDAKVLAYTADYKINLIDPVVMPDEDLVKLRSDLKEVFAFIKCAKDKDKLRALIENNEAFHNMKRFTAEMIKTITNINIEFKEEEDRVDMCLAIEQMREESRAMGQAIGETIGEARGKSLGLAEGKSIGVAEVLKNLGISEAEYQRILKEKENAQ